MYLYMFHKYISMYFLYIHTTYTYIHTHTHIYMCVIKHLLINNFSMYLKYFLYVNLKRLIYYIIFIFIL